MRHPIFEVYQDAAGGWRWRLRAANGLTVADGAEAYVSRSNAVRAARRVIELTASAEVA